MALLAQNRANAQKAEGDDDLPKQDICKRPAAKAKSKAKSKANAKAKAKASTKTKAPASPDIEAQEPPKKKGRPCKKPAAAPAAVQPAAVQPAAVQAAAPNNDQVKDDRMVLEAPHTFARRAKPTSSTGLLKYAKICYAFREHIYTNLEGRHKTTAEAVRGLLLPLYDI